jgi:hypothetical protein
VIAATHIGYCLDASSSLFHILGRSAIETMRPLQSSLNSFQPFLFVITSTGISLTLIVTSNLPCVGIVFPPLEKEISQDGEVDAPRQASLVRAVLHRVVTRVRSVARRSL